MDNEKYKEIGRLEGMLKDAGIDYISRTYIDGYQLLVFKGGNDNTATVDQSTSWKY